MRYIFTLFVLFISNFLFAQITITTTDLPAVGDTFNLQTQALPPSMSVPSIGSSQTWNYASTTPDGTSTALYLSNVGGFLSSSFPAATMSRVGSPSALLGINPSIPGIGSFPLPDATIYYHYGTNGLLIDGFSMLGNFVVIDFGDLAMKASSPDIQYIAPSTSGASQNVNIEYVGGQDPTPALTDTLLVIGVDRTISVVGSGNLTTPYISNEPALLYKEDISASLGFRITSFGFTVFDSTLASNLNFTRYYFLAKNFGYPVMSIGVDSMNAVQNVEFLDPNVVINIQEYNNLEVSTTTYANGFDILCASCNRALVNVFDEKGQLIMQKTLNAEKAFFDLSELSNGLYFIQVNNKNQRSKVLKLLKQ